jgi:hypothetical protein
LLLVKAEQEVSKVSKAPKVYRVQEFKVLKEALDLLVLALEHREHRAFKVLVVEELLSSNCKKQYLGLHLVPQMIYQKVLPTCTLLPKESRTPTLKG